MDKKKLTLLISLVIIFLITLITSIVLFLNSSKDEGEDDGKVKVVM